MSRLNESLGRLRYRVFDDPEFAKMPLRDRLDPMKMVLYFGVFRQLFAPKRPNLAGPVLLEEAEKDFLRENLEKHRQVLWINFSLIIYLIAFGISSLKSSGDRETVISGLLAPAMVTGTAWYTVSFAGIPTQFQTIAIVLTRFMFLAFSMSMTLLISLLCSITNPILSIFVLIPVYVSLYIASILYDTMDGLKIGLDLSLLKMSRAQVLYLEKYNLLTPHETEKGEPYAPLVRKLKL